MLKQINQSPKNTAERIAILLDQCNEFHGTQNIVIKMQTVNKTWVLEALRTLEAKGLITVLHSCGGRGRKTVYRRNRNTCLPRKVKR